jgi:hypothetical protein
MSRAAPLTWLLFGQKAGDNNQLLALAEALGWPFEIREFRYQPWELLSNRLLGATLAGVKRELSSELRPPWPQLVLTAGRRNEPIAKWLRRRAGGDCRLVHVGRPWSALDAFDLIVTTPQYRLPEQPNVLYNALPLHRVTAAGLHAAADALKPRLDGLARPFTTVLIGGNSGAFVFTAAKGAALGDAVQRLVNCSGGSVLATNSPRTPAPFYDAFRAGVRAPMRAWTWSPGADDNPYMGFLGLADQLVVTGESMSMLAEAASTGRPLYVFDPGEPDAGWWRRPHNWHHKVISQRLATRVAPRRLRRDVGRIQRMLVDSGRASWLGDGAVSPLRAPLPMRTTDLERAAARVRGLFISDCEEDRHDGNQSGQ